MRPLEAEKQSGGAPLLAGLMAVVFYLPGLCPYLLPGDRAVFVLRSALLRLDGYAQTHPLFLLLAYPFFHVPIIGGPLGVGLLSALCAGITVSLVFLIIRRLTESNWSAWAGVLSLTLAHTMWYYAVLPEVYTLATAFIAGMLYFAVRWYQEKSTVDLAAATFLGGLGCANHLLVGLSLAVCALWACIITLRERRSRAPLTWSAASGCLGLSLLLGFVAHDAQGLGWLQAVRMALVGGSGILGVTSISYGEDILGATPWNLAKQLGLSVVALVYNFPVVSLVCVACGAGEWFRRHGIRSLLLSIFAVHFLFAATYTVHEFWAFLLPAWVTVSVAVGLGFLPTARAVQRILNLRPRASRLGLLALLIAVPLVCYRTAPQFVHGLTDNNERTFVGPYQNARQEYFQFHLWPPKSGAYHSERWTRQLLASVPRDSALILSSGHRALAFYLQEVEDVRRDVLILGIGRNPVRRGFREKGDVFIAESWAAERLEENLEDYRIMRRKGLWQVMPKQQGGT